MADTITIDLDESSATSSLDKLVAGLGDAETQTQSLANAGQLVIDNQTQQITIIQKQSTEWKTFANTATESLGDVATASIELASDILHVEHGFQEFALGAGTQAVKTLANIAEMTVKYVLIAKGATAVIGAVRGTTKASTEATQENTASLEQNSSSLVETAAKATVLGLVLNTLTGNWESSTQAATTAGAAYAKWKLGLTQLTVIAVGVTAAIKAGAEFSEWMEKIEKDTEDATSDFGRLENAAAGAAKNISRPFAEVGPAFNGILGGIKDDFSKWFKQIGEDQYTYWNVGKWVDAQEKEFNEFGEFFENWIDEARGNFVRFEASARSALGLQTDSKKQLDNYAEEAKALRELSAWHEKMDKIRQQEAIGFEALGKANRDFDEAVKQRAHSEEIASLKTEEQVKSAMGAAQQLAAQRVQSGKVSPEEEAAHEKRRQMIIDNTEEAYKAAKTTAERTKLSEEKLTQLMKEETDYRRRPAQILAKDLEALEQRRTQIVEEETAKRVEKEKAAAESIKAAMKSLNDERESQTKQSQLAGAQDSGASEKELHEMRMRWIEEEAEARVNLAKSNDELIVIEADAEKKRIAETETFRRDQMKRSFESRKAQEAWLAANAAASDGIVKARAEFADAMELHSIEMKLQEQKDFGAKTKAQLETERQRQLAVQKEIHEKKLEIIERETDRELEASKTKEDALRAVSEGEKKRLREIADFEKQTAQDASDFRIKLAEEEQRKKDEKKNAQIDALKPNAQALLDSQTPQQQLKGLQDLRGKQATDKFRDDNSQLYEQSQLDPDARRKFAKGQAAADKEARRQALKDAQAGNVSAEDQAAVQGNIANKTLDQLSNNGKLDQGLVQSAQQAVQIQAQQQANTDELKRQVQQIQNAQAALIGASNPSRFRAGAGGQRG